MKGYLPSILGITMGFWSAMNSMMIILTLAQMVIYCSNNTYLAVYMGPIGVTIWHPAGVIPALVLDMCVIVYYCTVNYLSCV